ncbi:3-(methylthio)propionyl-CoA ligase [Caldimonas tepidiphila]|uniref:3-(methylthio)propionyl-CoA ligase n=1 Tax=Caldimonas tepidiphila TaxID=2315841 RepID=UPI000E5A7B64|nr:3-(methylthio)propionyl-CoA ligase [Caldimonas tepidiphila]
MARLMGQTMQRPLLISSLLTHAARHHSDTEIVSRRVEGDVHRYTYHDAEPRARRLAQALQRLDCPPGERVGTIAWNGYRHLELYYAVAGSGRVCHTINARLPPAQLAWMINHAEDRVLCFDLGFLPLVEKIAPQLETVRHYVLMTDRAHMPVHTQLPRLLCYEALVEAEDGDWQWPEFDENTASGLCYTTGTTEHPRGALYSHRSTVLHSYAAALPGALGCSAQDAILSVLPMSHVNGWGVPHVAPLAGAKLVFPGPQLDGRSLYELCEAEQVTFCAGVPAVMVGIVNHMQQKGLRFGSLRRTVLAGSACPAELIRSLEDELHVGVTQAWGMTELSPLGTVSSLKAPHLALPAERQRRLRQKQGRAVCGIDIEIVGDDGERLPWDGRTAGNLMVRGHWVVERHFKSEAAALQDGWFPTGDVATIDPDGFMELTDRTRDMIKSGGEWISAADLEDIAAEHPAVQEVAAIGCRHPKWGERPLLVVVRRPGASLLCDELLESYEGRIPRWQIPDDVVFVSELPHTPGGKVNKHKLREMLGDYALPTD